MVALPKTRPHSVVVPRELFCLLSSKLTSIETLLEGVLICVLYLLLVALLPVDCGVRRLALPRYFHPIKAFLYFCTYHKQIKCASGDSILNGILLGESQLLSLLKEYDL